MKFFNKEKKVKQGSVGRKFEPGDRVERDWGIMVISFVVLVVLVVLADGYLFMRINRGDFFSTDTPAELNSETLNRKTLLDVAGYFEAREQEYQASRSSGVSQIDPSI